MHIHAQDLEKKFVVSTGVSVPALRDVAFEIHSGETVAVVGPSGAGKSTLLHLVGLMDSPTGGHLLLDGQEFAGRNETERARMRREKIGFLFQLHYLLPEFTLIENLLLPVWPHRAQKEKTAQALLEQLGLSHRLHHLPSELSGGEQQRAALARALINEPSLLLADEPTGNLDRKTGEMVEEVIFSECAKRHITLMLVTHNPDLARKAGRIIEMQDGTIKASTRAAAHAGAGVPLYRRDFEDATAVPADE